jgi:hypothetical protein
MADVWSRNPEVSTMHPVGWDRSWLGRDPRFVGEFSQDLLEREG